jgi:putative phosphoesterase
MQTVRDAQQLAPADTSHLAARGKEADMLIGLISDIHGNLPARAKAALAEVDTILCAGDVEDRRILWELETIAPTIAVEGNCDRAAGLHADLPAQVSPKLDGVRFLMTHRPTDVGTPPPDVQVVVHGHTHVPKDIVKNGVRYINPGSPTYPRGGSEPSVAVMEIANGDVKAVKFIEVF